MTDKAQALIDELVSAAIAFGRGQLPDWQTRIEKAQRELREYVEGLEAERRWKDSNVELPKEDTDGNALLVICRYSGEWARAPFGIEFSDEFVRHYSHWMPLPTPPEVEECVTFSVS